MMHKFELCSYNCCCCWFYRRKVLVRNFGKLSEFGNSLKEKTQFFKKFWCREWENLASLVLETPTQFTFDGEISLGKGIFFTRIRRAKGYILKLGGKPLLEI